MPEGASPALVRSTDSSAATDQQEKGPDDSQRNQDDDAQGDVGACESNPWIRGRRSWRARGGLGRWILRKRLACCHHEDDPCASNGGTNSFHLQSPLTKTSPDGKWRLYSRMGEVALDV